MNTNKSYTISQDTAKEYNDTLEKLYAINEVIQIKNKELTNLKEYREKILDKLKEYDIKIDKERNK